MAAVLPSTSPRSDLPRTGELDAAREEAWNSLRLLASWDGEGTPGHEEGRRIVAAARRTVSPLSWTFDDAMSVIDPTGQAYPTAIDLAWAARKANA